MGTNSRNTYAKRTRRLSREVSVERTAGVLVPLAPVGRVGERMGVDKGQRRDSGNAFQQNLSRVQGLERLEGRGQFFERGDLVRRVMIATIEGGWVIGCGPAGLPYDQCDDDFYLRPDWA